MIGNKWDDLLKEEYQKDYFKKLIDFIKKEYIQNKMKYLMLLDILILIM